MARIPCPSFSWGFGDSLVNIALVTIVDNKDTCMTDISRINNCKKYMLATCRKLFEIIFHGSYMRIIPQHVSGHVRDTCMKFLGINEMQILHVGYMQKMFQN